MTNPVSERWQAGHQRQLDQLFVRCTDALDYARLRGLRRFSAIFSALLGFCITVQLKRELVLLWEAETLLNVYEGDLNAVRLD